jgi:hypothetical protein
MRGGGLEPGAKAEKTKEITAVMLRCVAQNG